MTLSPRYFLLGQEKGAITSWEELMRKYPDEYKEAAKKVVDQFIKYSKPEDPGGSFVR